MPAATTISTNRLGVWRRHGNHRNVEALLSRQSAQVLDVVDGHAASGFMPDLLVRHVEERGDFEALLAKAGVVGQRQPEVAGTHDDNAQAAIEPKDLTKIEAKLLDVVANAADAEFTEVGEVLANLRGVETEAARQPPATKSSARRRRRAR